MNERLKRVQRLEQATVVAGSIDAIEILFVEPTSAGPKYTGEVIVIPLNGERRTEHRTEIVGQHAPQKGLHDAIE